MELIVQHLFKFSINIITNIFQGTQRIKLSIQKKIQKEKNFKKGDIIFWKGHIAVCLNSKKLIHAYGPKKKVIITPINHTIVRIEKTANLKVKKVSKI